MPENRQIRLLAREGIHISNTTLNGYIHNGISRLREFMEDVFKEFVQQAKYLMVDETTELVGVETPEGKDVYKRQIFLFFIFNIMRMKFTFLLLSVFIFNMLLTASCSSNIHGDLNFTISLEEGDDATSCVYNIINKLSYDAAATISFEKRCV